MAVSRSRNIVVVSLPALLPFPFEHDEAFDHRSQPSCVEDDSVLPRYRDHNSVRKALRYKDLPKGTCVFSSMLAMYLGLRSRIA